MEHLDSPESTASAQSGTAEPAEDPATRLGQHEQYVQRVAASVCRRHGYSPDRTEDFVQECWVKLWDDDLKVIRQFQGRCQFTTYLATVINRLFVDILRKEVPRWRPSAFARSQGPDAVRLERLMTRDGRSFEEACRSLKENYGVTRRDAELEAWASRFPERSSVQAEPSPDATEAAPDPRPDPEEKLRRKERLARKEDLLRAFQGGAAALEPEDRVIVKMLLGGHKIAAIARALHLEQKPLYRRIEKRKQDLREALEEEGFDAREVLDVLRGWQ